MSRRQIAAELVVMAKRLTASGGLRGRLDAAEDMLNKGGRGTELAIREIEMLAQEATKLAKRMRKIQWDIPSYEERQGQRALLEELEMAI